MRRTKDKSVFKFIMATSCLGFLVISCGESKENQQSREALSGIVRRINAFFSDYSSNLSTESDLNLPSVRSYFFGYQNRLADIRQLLVAVPLNESHTSLRVDLDSVITYSCEFINRRLELITAIHDLSEDNNQEFISDATSLEKKFLLHSAECHTFLNYIDSLNHSLKNIKFRDSLTYTDLIADTTDYLHQIAYSTISLRDEMVSLISTIELREARIRQEQLKKLKGNPLNAVQVERHYFDLSYNRVVVWFQLVQTTELLRVKSATLDCAIKDSSGSFIADTTIVVPEELFNFGCRIDFGRLPKPTTATFKVINVEF